MGANLRCGGIGRVSAVASARTEVRVVVFIYFFLAEMQPRCSTFDARLRSLLVNTYIGHTTKRIHAVQALLQKGSIVSSADQPVRSLISTARCLWDLLHPAVVSKIPHLGRVTRWHHH